MTIDSPLLETDILGYLKQHENKELLRFLTCGSVDDGKSTLIGRLLHDSKMIFEDHLDAIKNDSKRFNTTDEEFDLALLVDGLQSEREQGITIDVAYRYFTTDKRKFIIADTPGHEQYTRNMATGASTCDLAIVMIDARKGVLTQSKRHSFIASLLGIKHVIVAVNKMDLVDYSQQRYEEIQQEYLEFSEQLNIPDIQFVPISALRGDNVVNKGENLPWYQGETLMSILDTIEIASDRNLEDFRFPVQYVIRPNLDFRGFAGTIASGVIQPGDEILALPSGKTSKVKTISTFDGELEQASAAQAIVITLEDEIDISRGDMLVKAGDNIPQPAVTDRVQAHVIWMSETALQPHKQYAIKLATKQTTGSIAAIAHKVDVNTLEESETTHLELNEIGLCEVKFTQPVVVDGYREHRSTGAFIIVDRITNATVGVGMVTGGFDENRVIDASELDREQLVSSVVEQLDSLKLSLDNLGQENLEEIKSELGRLLFKLSRGISQQNL